ncbi:zinc finger CCCH domain-containing protein 14 [Stomoxys calcitrans]|uniref:zinc finger CCCH domain-containing protein 14 n=1 Tax=Stomoxys calcitrans TaxID=35570 RepID=UPI0027E34581|nr:zinc finger CCCH domain-containing protein 14 [Stomoxys calcitrans]
MENYGNEIGQKMRSAVKAKLQELGSAGYIDDELPDYVMIMVANKRSKQQMISDLNLFLGNQTELFVTWLHEVLQKLQEVTLPAIASSSKKRKSSQKEDTTQSSAPSNKKDKKQLKKDKLPVKKLKDGSPDKHVSGKTSNSIRDMFAEELLEKAKQNISATADIAQNIKKGKIKAAVEEDADTSSEQANETQDFDIPTISEISSTTGANIMKPSKETPIISGNREKDLAELAEIQKKIYAAKRQLKQIGELDDDEYDEDFITIREDESREAFNETVDMQTTPPAKTQRTKVKSPIVFEKEETIKNKEADYDEDVGSSRRNRFTPPLSNAASGIRGNSSSRDEVSERAKRPVHERLGMKSSASTLKEPTKSTQHVSRDRRRNLQEKELYVPAFRRKEMERERDRTRDVERDLSRDRERGNLRDRGRDRERERARESDGSGISRGRSRVRRSAEDREKRRASPEKINDVRSSSQVGKISTTTFSSSADNSPDGNSSSRKRIGSRVIVAPAKVMDPSDEEDISDKPVNSVIKIKPRATVSPSKQAPKNLLLRAVAEAQKSTILKRLNPSKPKISSRLGEKVVPERNTKLYSKSFRDRRKTTSSVGAIFSRTAQNLIVEVNGRPKERYPSSSHGQLEDEEEYIPEIVSDKGESEPDLIYVPQAIKTKKPLNDDEEENWSTGNESCYEHIDLVEDVVQRTPDNNTQFVVTLNDEKTFPKLKRRGKPHYSISPSPPPQVSSSSNNSKDREKYAEPTSTSGTLSSRRSNAKERKSSKVSGNEHESSPFTLEGSTTPPKRSELIEVYRKPKEVKKIIIQNDSEDDDMSPTKKRSPDKDSRNKRSKDQDYKSETPPLKTGTRSKESLTPSKRKHAPIKFDLDHEAKDKKESQRESPIPSKKRRSTSGDRSRDRERDISHERREEKRKISISIRNTEGKKYENVPSSLNSVPVDSSAYRNNKPKERCKYHPNCTKSFCEFYHPTTTCKSFPNCKYADKCIYSHPRCKYDLACVNLDCNFSHSGPRSTSLLEPAAPPLSSSVVPVQNYKSISSATVTGPVSATTCKFFPNCTKSACPFYHPKPCRYGKNCINKLECLFYHHEVLSSSKFKWVASN